MKSFNSISKTILLSTLVILLNSCGGSKVASSSGGKEKADNPQGPSAVKTAKTYIGTKYKYGGYDKKGIDCSGLTCRAYESVGCDLPRSARDQGAGAYGKRVYIGELQEGDLIFFSAKKGSTKITHVGIISKVVKANESVKFIHASTSRGVMESDVFSSYWRPLYVKAVRPKTK